MPLTNTKRDNASQDLQGATYGALDKDERKNLHLRDNALYNVSQGVLIADANRIVIYANKGFEKITGYTQDDIVGKNCSILQGALTNQDVASQIRECLNDKKVISCEIQNYKKDGSVFWNELTITPIFDDSNVLTNFIGIQNDITKRKESEQKRIESEEMLRAVYDVIPIGISVLDRSGSIIDCNNASEKLLGVTKEEHLSRCYNDKKWSIVRPDMSVVRYEEYPSVKAMQNKQTTLNEEIGILKESGATWLSVSAMPVAYQHIGVIMTYVDITDEKISAKTLKAERNFVNTVFDATNSIIAVIDRNGSMIRFNKAAEEFTGYSRDEVKEPMFWANFLKTEQRGGVQAVFEAAKNGFVKNRYENYWVSKSGENRLFDWTNSLITDENGAMTHLVTVGVDITERKKAEIELMRAKKEADEANKAKSQFLANMSHEIRTPMNAIIGFSELVLDAKLEAEQREYIEQINSSSKFLLGIINDILDFSKIEADKLEFEYVVFELNEIVSKLTTIFAKTASKKGLRLLFSIDPSAPKYVKGDLFRITQALANLVSNAIKFSENGCVELVINQIKAANSKSALEFIVKDTGIGIGADELSKLFQPFTQADISTTRKYGGTGLGLAITKKIVEGMDGTISVESKQGEGSVFRFVLELETPNINEIKTNESYDNLTKHLSHISDETTKKIAKKVTTTPKALLNGVKILLVEDNEINQEVAKKMLSRIGAIVELANNGKEGVDKINANPDGYDVVLMDIQMPIMGGYEASRLIKEKNSALPIIALTAAVMAEDREKAIQAGMDDYISKPIYMDELYKIVEKWSKKQQAEHTATDAQIDFEELSITLGKDEELIRRVLESFLKELNGAFANLESELNNTTKDTGVLLHTLKGVCGNIRAVKSAKIVEKIEYGFKRGEPIKNSDIAELIHNIEKLKIVIGEKLKKNGKQPLERLTKKELEIAVHEVKDKLQKSEMIDFLSVEKIYFSLEGVIKKADLTQWKDFIDSFEYDKALAIMNDWAIN